MSEIFISWSKERSLALAKAFRQLMSQVLGDRAVAPTPPLGPGSHVITLSEDLPKGGSWFANLAGLLENARAGVICVTPENVTSPWLLFEAGALIRCDVEVALFPVLLDLPAAAMEGPLALVQATVIERDPAAIKRETFDLLSRIVITSTSSANTRTGSRSSRCHAPTTSSRPPIPGTSSRPRSSRSRRSRWFRSSSGFPGCSSARPFRSL